MSELTHTPGEWEVDCCYPDKKKGFYIRSIHGDICDLYFRGKDGIHDHVNAEANAHLIAAAPDLYEALLLIHDANEDCIKDNLPLRYPESVGVIVKAALKKARGEQ